MNAARPNPRRPQSARAPPRTSAIALGNVPHPSSAAGAMLARRTRQKIGVEGGGVFHEAAIPHPTMQSDPKQRMLQHPPQAAPVVAADSRKSDVSVEEADVNHAHDMAKLPVGWAKLESRTYPGMYYYLTSDGVRQWNAPHHTKAQQRAKKQKLATIYMADYPKWGNVSEFNPVEVNTATKASASYALHPTAKKDPNWGISVKQKEHRRFDVEPAAPSIGMWPLHVVSPFGCTSSYRADFKPQQPKRPFSASRNRTPPRQLGFDHNSTNRADFVDHHPKRPKLVHPAPQLHFNDGRVTLLNSTSRQDFVNHGQRVVAGARRPKHFKDPGWVRNVKSTHHGTTTFAFSKDGSTTGSHRQPAHYQIIDPLESDDDCKSQRSQRSCSTRGRGSVSRGNGGGSAPSGPTAPFITRTTHTNFSSVIPPRPPSSSNVSVAAAEDLRNVVSSSYEEQLQRGVPVVSGKLQGTFHSTYGDDFVDGDSIVSKQSRQHGRALDRKVVKRVKAHQNLRGFE